MNNSIKYWTAILVLLGQFLAGCGSKDDTPTPVNTIYNPDLTYGTISDANGNEYKTIAIGSNTWIAGNLKVTKFNDSTNISFVTNDQDWSDATSPAYCYYQNDASLRAVNGILYNWYVVQSGKICPQGYHVPTDAEWTELEIYLQNHNYNFDGVIDTDNDRLTNNKIAKSLASSFKWVESNYEGSVGSKDYEAFRNKSGFSAIPSGYRNYDGTFHDRGYASYWWTSTEASSSSAWNRYLAFDYGNVFRMNYEKNIGLSVCCVMDAKK